MIYLYKGDTMIVIDDVDQSYGKELVLQDISLKIKKATIFGLLGPSGAGKTTLIRLITGSLLPNRGSIYVDKCRVPSFDAIKKIGFMPQSDGLYNEISGYDNLAFFGELFNLKGNKLKSRIKNVLKLVDLDNEQTKLVSHYSIGMKKRLSLACSLIHEPKILLLDEPTVGIDPILRKKIWEEFNRLKEKGITLIVTTHILDEVSMCDEVALINNGRVIKTGKVKDLINSTKSKSLEEIFITKEKK